MISAPWYNTHRGAGPPAPQEPARRRLKRGVRGHDKVRGGLALLAAVLALAAVPARADITGKARVIDGHTVEVAGRRVRLHGIHAPALDQTCRWPGRTIDCGTLAKLALMDLTAGTDVVCRPRDRDPDGPFVAVCFADGFDIGRNMVHTGWALAYRAQSTVYVDTEETARKAKRGMWRGTFVKPWDWRRP